MFTMHKDSGYCHIIQFRVWGLWELHDAFRFGDEARTLIATLPVPFGQHISCMDISDFKIQTQAVVKVCLSMVMQGMTGRRSAFIIGDGLARIQVKRVTGHASIKTFEDEQSAKSWLLSSR